MNELIKNYDNLSLEYKYIKCTDRLLKIENELLKFDEYVLNEWYFIQSLDMFKNQKHYFDSMISSPTYKNLMNTKKILELEIVNLNKFYKIRKEVYDEIKPMQESISLHMEVSGH